MFRNEERNRRRMTNVPQSCNASSRPAARGRLPGRGPTRADSWETRAPFADPQRHRGRWQRHSRVQSLKQQGVDGIKILGIDRDLMGAMEDEAHKVGLRIAHHVGVEETNAWDDIKFGTTSIEHWYGIPDAAIDDHGQKFPATYN